MKTSLNHRKTHRHACIALAWWLACLCDFATAQVRLPDVPLPHLPVELPVDVNHEVNNVTGATENLTDLRRLRIRELVRVNRRTLETDRNGAPIVRNELLAYSPTEEALARASAAGFSIVRTRTLEALDESIVVLAAPPHMSTQTALKRLRALDPAGSYDFNHLYMESGEVAQSAAVARPLASSSVGDTRMRVGLIDTGIDRRHPAFEKSTLTVWGCNNQEIPAAHGTAVASLLIADAPEFHGAAPHATLFAANVYCGQPQGGAVDVLAAALAWLAHEHVAVINVSLVGPPNVLLERIIKRLVNDGFLIVAAVGNDGPASPPLYPAAYPGVVGVTGVDAHRKVIIEAVRGKQVMFAAPGADMAAASTPIRYASVRGTSFAAPIVAGLLAAHLMLPNPAEAQKALEFLRGQAIDLGTAGFDSVYGFGAVGESARVLPEKALLATQR